MVYLVVAVFVLHIISLPIIVSAEVFVDSDENIGLIRIKLFFVTVFEKRVEVNGAVKNFIDKKEALPESTDDKNEKKTNGNGTLKKLLFAFGREIIKRIRVREICADVSLGLGDAAASAFAVGTANIIIKQAKAIFGFDGGDINIRPDYNNESIFIDFFGIISLQIGDIIYAACAAAISVIAKHAQKRRYHANTVTE